jgi:hypothetical protein
MARVTVKDFLSQPWEGRLPFPYEDSTNPTIPDAPTPTKLQVLAVLIYRNGGRMRVNSWGVMDGGGLYRYYGLEQSEALALISAAAYIQGLMDGSDVTEKLGELFDAEYNRVAAIRNYKESP